MLPRLLHLIGVSDEIIKHYDETKLALTHPELLWAGLLLLVPVGYWIYRRQQQNLASAPPALRIALSITRITVLLLLVWVLGGPYLKLHYEAEQRPIVALLFDHSQSMRLEAGPFETEDEVRAHARAEGYQVVNNQVTPETRKALNKVTRAKHVQAAVQASARTLLDPLAKKYELQYYSFAQDVRPFGVDAQAPKLPEPPAPRDGGWGPATRLGDAVAHVLNEAAGRKVAALVVFSDGQNTGGRSPAEAALMAASAGAPIFTVPAGVSKRLKDVAVVDVFTSGLVSVGDTVRVAVTLESQGFDKRPVKVELREGDKLLDAKDLVLRSTEQQQLELTFQAKEAGARYLTVLVPPQPEEPKELHVNNSEVAFVRVSDEKLRVLYVEGLPRWDFRFLKNAMQRDHGLGGRQGNQPDIVLEAEWRRLKPDQQAAALPRTLKDLAEYHTIILGDVSPQLLTAEFVDLLVEAVRDKGVGLVVEAGPRFMPHAFGRKLQELLPVQLRRNAAGLDAPVYKQFVLELSPEIF